MKANKGEIQKEYDETSRQKEEFQKVKWGSHDKMYNRFYLALKYVDFENVNYWLDVGSGTGGFQVVVKQKFPSVDAIGIEISQELLEFAKTRKELKNYTGVKFELDDFLEYKKVGFDLITSIGVLQKTNMAIQDFFSHAYALLNRKGQIFIYTKNIHWEKFDEPGFEPEETLDWYSGEQLITAAKKVGFKYILIEGFIPGENKVVKPNQSHTIFLIANKA